MPGKLTASHKKYEENCDKCHLSFDQASQVGLCRDCHEKVDQDIHSKEGFHGQLYSMNYQECRNCHSDHKGRNADIVGIIEQVFNHDLTDFKLTGAHITSECSQCHLPGKKYREAPQACFDCHEKQDIHKKEMGESCNDCHKTDSWKKSNFDHEKTKFPLKHKHKDVVCASCHPDQKYKKIPRQCVTCHQLQDKHGGLFGDKCDSCHQEKGWKESFYDHSNETDFRLRGKHTKASCHTCHTEKSRDKKLPKTCFACHRPDDIHQGSQGQKCHACHDEKSWAKQAFDHAEKADLALLGRHKELTCYVCHSEVKKEEQKARTCRECHQQDDFHHCQQGDQCQNCHSEEGWRDNLSFDHGLTRFPLVGLHATVNCQTCHADQAYVGADKACNACHQYDDLHQSSLGKNCELCHNPNGWERWSFEHDNQSDYPLTGQHAQANCSSCHVEKVHSASAIKLKTQCYGCHLQDDSHRGSYGNSCERCHQTSSFSDIRIKQ